MKTPICDLCCEQEVEMENGEPTSSFCNPCFFDVLDLKLGEMWIWEEQMKGEGYNYQTVPIQVLNPFDSIWEDSEYIEMMEEAKPYHKHLEKFKDIPSKLWGVDKCIKKIL